MGDRLCADDLPVTVHRVICLVARRHVDYMRVTSAACRAPLTRPSGDPRSLSRHHPISRERTVSDTPDPTAAWSFETQQIHAGATADPTTGARATPIYQTTSYTFRDTEHAADTVRARRARQHLHADHEPHAGRARAARRGARGRRRGASPFASGQAAQTLAILNIAEAGDHIVSCASLYGGTYNLFHYTLPEAGHRGLVRRGPRRPRGVAAPLVQAQHEGLLRRDDGQPAAATSWTSRRWRTSRTRPACR